MVEDVVAKRKQLLLLARLYLGLVSLAKYLSMIQTDHTNLLVYAFTQT